MSGLIFILEPPLAIISPALFGWLKAVIIKNVKLKRRVRLNRFLVLIVMVKL